MQVQENFPIAEKLYYKIGGIVRYFIEASSVEDIRDACRFIEEKRISRVFVCGTGSNLIFTDDMFEGLVLMISPDTSRESFVFQVPDVVTAFAGNTLDSVIAFSFENNLTGLEWAGGLPGTVGAAVRGNVGAFGGEIKDVVVSVDVLEKKENEYKSRTLSREELQFSYRDSLIKQTKDMIVLSATFRLNPVSSVEANEARKTADANREYRRSHHPLEYPNCGSVFKNIAKKDEVEKVLTVWPNIADEVHGKWHGKASMGYLIKRFGLSGHRVGNAMVSEKHGNFIVNLGDAKAEDVKQIIKEIQNTTFQHFGFVPEVEVEIVI